MNKTLYINPLLQPFLNPSERFCIAYGGRASGKSWGIADILLLKAQTERNKLILCVKGTMRSISDSVKSLLEASIIRHNLEEYFYITDKEIVCKQSGSRFIFYGLQHPDRLKSLEGVSYLWVEEATVDITEAALDVLFPTIIRNKGSKIYITFNPKKEEDAVYKRFIYNSEADSLVVKINYYDNPYLSDEIKSYIEDMKNSNYKKYLHIFEGELMKADEGALWKDEMIDRISDDEKAALLLSDFEALERIVVAIDPAITSKITSDATGIVVAGKYKGRDEYLIIHDGTRISSPNQWSADAIALYDKYKADRIVAETNQGGDMVRTIIKNKRHNIPYKGVHASRGKTMRAEPIADLYAEGKVRHLDNFSNLEYEMMTFCGKPSDKSPNALDAMVWALTELSSRSGKGPKGMVKAVGQLSF